MASKKNQHFIPQFFLRQFSLGNKKEVGAYLTNKSKFIEAVPIKSQCSKPYFYGKDDSVENFFGKFESDIAPLFSKLIKLEGDVNLDFNELAKLVLFITLMELRNPVFFMQYHLKNELLNNEINKELQDSKVYLDLPKATHEETVSAMLSLLDIIYEGYIDLDVKFLINRTDKSFVCSDFPLVKYNRFLNLKKYFRTKIANGSVGIQVFIPISSSITMVFYDSSIYKLGNKKDCFFELNDDKQVFDLNMLQYLNSNNCIYFDENMNEAYLKILDENSRKYDKPNLPYIESSYLISNNNQNPSKNDLFVFKKTETNYFSSFDYFNLTKNSTKYVFKDSLSQLRPTVEFYLNSRLAKDGLKSLNIESYYKKK